MAKGIAAFISKRGKRPGNLVIERVGGDGVIEIVRFDGDSADAAKVAAALQARASAPRPR